GEPSTVVDLTTEEGLALVGGHWRYSDARIVEVDFVAAGADGQPTGRAVRTYDYTPHAGGSMFDDSNWEVVPPADLARRRGNGRISFNWYRLRVTVPERIGPFDPTGSSIVFETALDDYAEVWVDGELTRGLGQSGGSVIAGWNAANRLVVGRNVRPGQRIQLAVFGANGPLSNPPTNYIWMRSAKLEFYPTDREPIALSPREVNVEIIRRDSAIDRIVGPNPKVHKLAEGFTFTEGPVWVNDGRYLLFSDPNENRIYKYASSGQLSVFRERSGYDGSDIGEYRQPGSNGLTLDRDGNVTVAQHGKRRVVRLGAGGAETAVIDTYEGKRLNSPNDLVFRSDGALFFTDPPFGLPKFGDDPRKELAFSGVYSVHLGKTRLLTDELSGPNGIAFSPDERYLYVGNWDESRKVVMRYEVNSDASVRNGIVFFDMTDAAGEDAIDGVKVDQEGNVYVSGPGGLWVLSPTGRHLGTILTAKHVHNMAWGDEDGRTLYMCARDGLYRMRLNIPGLRPEPIASSR
ncbi:MAG: SMP-30/gluconolactonase/LRE family protein, partial [Rhodothermales bacterium]|nr:SMP-30/gluconolactonase/LRE family protein [Rhodothermales bacterium]